MEKNIGKNKMELGNSSEKINSIVNEIFQESYVTNDDLRIE